MAGKAGAFLTVGKNKKCFQNALAYSQASANARLFMSLFSPENILHDYFIIVARVTGVAQALKHSAYG
jgi:hypothetical protein